LVEESEKWRIKNLELNYQDSNQERID
jgi:hypothetical protein